jgi:general L-amino acid transport system substrate-binding protein
MKNILVLRDFNMRRFVAAACVAALAGLWSTASFAGPTLDAVKARGSLTCGVSTGLLGFSQADASGNYTGIDVDMCRAVATAIFGSPKVKFVPLTADQRYPALKSGQIDMLSRNSTVTLQNEAGQGLLFGPIVFYDGQGILVPKRLNLKSAKQLTDQTICLQAGSTSIGNFDDYVKANGLKVKTQLVPQDLPGAMMAGKCDGISTDASGLAVMRAGLPTPADYAILPERLSREPLAPAVRNIDVQFYEIMRWSIYATIEADQLKVTSKNVDDMLSNEDAKIKRLLGVIPGNGAALGLDEKFAYNIIKQVGNYNEIFLRNVGALSVVKLERGMNDGWTVGGLIFSPPFR